MLCFLHSLEREPAATEMQEGNADVVSVFMLIGDLFVCRGVVASVCRTSPNISCRSRLRPLRFYFDIDVWYEWRMTDAFHF